jgi:hypothetical protein
MELLVKPEILTSYIYIYMDLYLTTLKAVSFYLLHNVSTLNQCRKLSCVTVVCKHFASQQYHPIYGWDLIRYAKGSTVAQSVKLQAASSIPDRSRVFFSLRKCPEPLWVSPASCSVSVMGSFPWGKEAGARS